CKFHRDNWFRSRCESNVLKKMPTSKGRKAVEGLRPSFSAHVGWCEHGAPVRSCRDLSRLEERAAVSQPAFGEGIEFNGAGPSSHANSKARKAEAVPFRVSLCHHALKFARRPTGLDTDWKCCLRFPDPYCPACAK